MDFLNQIWSEVGNYIEPVYLLIIMLLGYLVKQYFNDAMKKVFKWYKMVYAVLAIATVVGVFFVIFTETTWVKILFTYALATSLHELLFRYLERLWQKK
jgi:hypothetical protein